MIKKLLNFILETISMVLEIALIALIANVITMLIMNFIYN